MMWEQYLKDSWMHPKTIWEHLKMLHQEHHFKYKPGRWHERHQHCKPRRYRLLPRTGKRRSTWRNDRRILWGNMARRLQGYVPDRYWLEGRFKGDRTHGLSCTDSWQGRKPCFQDIWQKHSGAAWQRYGNVQALKKALCQLPWHKHNLTNHLQTGGILICPLSFI